MVWQRLQNCSWEKVTLWNLMQRNGHSGSVILRKEKCLLLSGLLTEKTMEALTHMVNYTMQRANCLYPMMKAHQTITFW